MKGYVKLMQSNFDYLSKQFWRIFFMSRELKLFYQLRISCKSSKAPVNRGSLFHQCFSINRYSCVPLIDGLSSIKNLLWINVLYPTVYWCWGSPDPAIRGSPVNQGFFVNWSSHLKPSLPTLWLKLSRKSRFFCQPRFFSLSRLGFPN